MIKGIDHVALAVENVDEALMLFGRVFGVTPDHRETIPVYSTEVATIKFGNTCIELVAGTTPDSPISKFVAKRGPGIHHIALEVDDIHQAIERIAHNADMIDAEPRIGKDHSRVAFIHPKSMGNILLELVENRE